MQPTRLGENKKAIGKQMMLSLIIVAILIGVVVWFGGEKLIALQKQGAELTSDNSCLKAGKDETYYNRMILRLLAENTEMANLHAANNFTEFASCYPDFDKIKVLGDGKATIGHALLGINQQQYALYFYNKYLESRDSKNPDQEKEVLFNTGKIYYDSGNWEMAAEKLTTLRDRPEFLQYRKDEVEYMLYSAKFNTAKDRRDEASLNLMLSTLTSFYNFHYNDGIVDDYAIKTAFLLGSYYYEIRDYDNAIGWFSVVRDQPIREAMIAQSQIAYSYWVKGRNEADNMAIKRELLANAVMEFERYSGVALKSGISDWKLSHVDLMTLEACKAQHELARAEEPQNRMDAYKKAIDICANVIAYGAQSPFYHDATSISEQIKSDCANDGGGC